jgi:hypothetical protein
MHARSWRHAHRRVHLETELHAHLRTELRTKLQTDAPVPAEKPGDGMEARHAVRPEGKLLGGRNATSGLGSGKRNGLNDKASRETGIWRPAVRRPAIRQPGIQARPASRGSAVQRPAVQPAAYRGCARRRTQRPRREKSAVIVISSCRPALGWNVPDNAPPRRIAARGIKNSGRRCV